MTREATVVKPRCGLGGVGVVLLLAVSALPLAPAQAPAAQGAVESGAVYEGWTSSEGERATQFHVPLRLAGRAGDFSASLLTAYANTRVSGAGGGDDDSLSTLVDTKVGASYEVVEKLPVDLLVGLDLNLPTGKTRLSRDELRLSLDPELISLPTFGEGFNVNPTLTVAKSWGRLAGGLGLGYLWRGTYDPTDDLEDYRPGAVGTATAELRWAIAADWEARLVGKGAVYAKDELDGEDVFREGNYYSLLLGTGWAGAQWRMSVALEGVYRADSDVLDATWGPRGSIGHGREVRGTVTAQRAAGRDTAVSAALKGLYITDNNTSDSDETHIGARTKAALVLGASHRFTPALDGGLDVGGFWLRDEEVRFPEAKEPTIYRGASAALRLTARF